MPPKNENKMTQPKQENNIIQSKQEDKNLSLQKEADKLYAWGQDELKSKKTGRETFSLLLLIASGCFVACMAEQTVKENAYSFGILASLFMLNYVSYQKSKANIERQVLGSIKNKEMGTKEYKENETRYKSDFKLLNDARKIDATNILGFLIALGGLLTLTGGAITEKITYPTGILAGLVICSATNYWSKHNIEHINNRYKSNLNKIIKLKSLEKE